MVEKRDFPENLEDFKEIMTWFDGLSEDEVTEAIREQIVKEKRWLEDRRPDSNDNMVPLLYTNLETLKSDLHVTQKINLEGFGISTRFEAEKYLNDKTMTPKRAALLLCPSAFIKKKVEAAGEEGAVAESEAAEEE